MNKACLICSHARMCCSRTDECMFTNSKINHINCEMLLFALDKKNCRVPQSELFALIFRLPGSLSNFRLTLSLISIYCRASYVGHVQFMMWCCRRVQALVLPTLLPLQTLVQTKPEMPGRLMTSLHSQSTELKTWCKYEVMVRRTLCRTGLCIWSTD